MYSKFIKIIAAVLLGVAIFIVWNFYTGNPFTYFKVRGEVSRYLVETYGEGYTYTCRYSGFGHEKVYICDVEKENSMDIRFDVFYDTHTQEIRDNYKVYVADKTTTLYRINDEYKAMVKPVFETVDNIRVHDAHFYSMPQDLLETDKVYDIDEISALYGTLVMSFEEEEGGMNEFADKMMEIKRLCDDRGIKFAYIDLQSTVNGLSFGGINIDSFPYSEITGDNLAERLAVYGE